jgi:hypothetical protein
MPISPGKNETQDEFISRCVSTEVSAGKEQAQAVAICYSKWKDRRRKELSDEL